MAKTPYGYTGKILKVNLTTGEIGTDTPDDGFYRKYLGGGAVGAYYCLSEMKPRTDAMSPESVIVFAAGIMTGAALAGASRFCVTARSPLTGCIGDTQCGGGFGPELKFAGFDAVVITGRSEKPVYLWIHDGEADLRDAGGVWGMFTAETRAALAAELGDERVKAACIGPAGEKLVRYANISGGASDYAGRTGMGCVMGSKNLKAVVCRGAAKPVYADPDGVKAMAKRGAVNFKSAGFPQFLRQMGTAGVVTIQNNTGGLPTRNSSRGSFDGARGIAGELMKDKLTCATEACYACVVRCKQVVRAPEDGKYPLVPEYGGPEYESIAMLGSNLEIGDMESVAFANQLCNAFGLDTITTGAVIAYAFECYENGLIGKKQAGMELRFGDADTALKLIENIAAREGIGDKLADGLEACVEAFGAKTAEYAVHVKNNPLPAHLAQVKMSQALMYAVNPFGADHMSCEHDSMIMALGETARGLSLDEKRMPDQLDHEKVRMVVYSQFYYSLLDTMSLCAFCWGPGALFEYEDMTTLLRAATGWKVTFWELMKAGERRVNMMRAFNAREGIDSQYDRLPKRVLKPMPGPGAGEGKHVPVEALDGAIKLYYDMMHWDVYSGRPTPAKLRELGLSWLLD